MKKLIVFALLGLFFNACDNKVGKTEVIENSDLEYFGEKISAENAISSEDFFETFREGDSIQMTMNGKINEVCKKKGCWMSMSIGTDEEIMVRFKDYGFFVPLNADGRMSTVQGWAYKEVMSIEELKHYAFDAGDSDEEIAAITEPEISYTFMANGVIIE
jgi:hypothetical protein